MLNKINSTAFQGAIVPEKCLKTSNYALTGGAQDGIYELIFFLNS